MTQYCSNCGSEILSVDSVFCEQCGAKLPAFSSKNLHERNVISGRHKHSKSSSPPQFYSSPYRHASSRKPVFFGFMAIVVILALSGALFVALISNDMSYEHLGGTFALYERLDLPNMTEVEFIIDNSVGYIQIDFVENQSEPLIFIELEVFGPSGKSIGDANMFETQEFGNRTLFMFDSFNDYSNDHFNYDIFIQVSTLLVASFDVQVITGGIGFQAGGNNKIEKLSLETTTGSIYASLEDTYFPGMNPKNSLKTVTGNIDTQFNNLICDNDIYWNIETVSGSIYAHFDQVVIPQHNSTYHLDLAAVTGQINYNFNFNDSGDIGYYLNSQVTTGQTIISGFSESINLPYFSPNFSIASLKYITNLETTTGSISIFKG